ncbi:hypothetical protein FQN50_007644 [Emmonsiellopsis sp. PD_5]|nr:hypothetical protein FQN50_007644 [Emmonsiellopsis sp. PD_5]
MTKRSREEEPLVLEERLETPLSSRISSRTMQSTTSPPRGKVAHLDNQNGVQQVMRCSLPPHREAVSFSSYEEYEVHYAQAHVNRCSECGKNFPTAHFLTLHIEELHDPLIQARRAKGEKTFACFVEGCDRKCSTAQKRRMHLIDKHSFPRLYNFAIVNTGIDQRDSMLRGSAAPTHRRRVSVPNSTQHENRLRRRKLSQSMSGDIANGTEPSSTPIDNGGDNNDDTTATTNGLPGTMQLPMHVKSDLGSRSSPRPVEMGNVRGNAKSEGDDMAELEKSMSSLRFVPPSVTLRSQRERQHRQQQQGQRQ